MLDPRLYEYYTLDGVFVAFVILLTLVSLCASIFITHVWSPTGTYVRRGELTEFTQRRRYANLLVGAIFPGFGVMAIMIDPNEFIYRLIVARHDHPFAGWTLTIACLVPFAMLLTCVLTMVKVYFRPSFATRTVLFGPRRGYFYLPNPNARRFGFAPRETSKYDFDAWNNTKPDNNQD